MSIEFVGSDSKMKLSSLPDSLRLDAVWLVIQGTGSMKPSLLLAAFLGSNVIT
jgi:hypothetical protein